MEYPNVRRRQRPPSEYPTSESPHFHQGKKKDSSESKKGRRKRDQSTIKQQILVLLGSLSGLGVWYLTPVASWITTVLVQQIPVDADVILGRAALAEFESEYKAIYHPHWSPLVEQVGRELISTLERTSSDVLEQAGGEHHAVEKTLVSLLDGLSPTTTRTSSKARIHGFKWDFAVVKAPIVNAFALPGGYIRVTDKLLETLSPTRGELASLLGHEIGHALFRHSQKRIVQQKMFQLVISALTYEDHDEDEETFGEALGELLLQSAQFFGRQKFSRDDEYQADATGWILLQNSKSYNPQSVESLLTKLWTLQGKTPTTLDWMSTHPATENRIEALQEKWKGLNRREKKRLEYRPI
ncbi:Metalloendopeptidase OMA1, mitochondrial [Seminavis robusta]|uniref:Metalloendopeptidase OMA1, mitochondrial n=1 Tax=Seminavis robusta TaxID=568900 RepID=A0A9N8H3F3_9STRA|nr:Metalloendopeptidase OMA1, mitochondrial [Seminavis robusta]|eukprot:Sro25_g017130.1 Metalloendopeptidase OMA1, mitochondrial (355) ;mRNA; f:121077-122141